MIFLDLHKAYDTLDRDRCLEILDGYDMGTQDFWILRTCWGWLRMAKKAGW